MNQQIRLGEDLMSRVSYVMMNDDDALNLRSLARDTVGKLIAELAEGAACSLSDITEIVFVGNPIMHHSFLGFDVVPLGQMPFDLATESAVELPAVDLELPAPMASTYFAPCIAGHVGADAAAAILGEGTASSRRTTTPGRCRDQRRNRVRQRRSNFGSFQSDWPRIRGR